MTTDRLLVAGFCAFVICLVLTPLVREVARTRHMYDHPNERSSHSIPIPRVGGVAIVAGTLLGSALAVQYLDWRLFLMGVASLVLASAGLVDDLRPIAPIQKYGPQLIGGLLAATAIDPTFNIDLPFVQLTVSGIPALAIAVFWIVAFINVLNFMDGLDGLAAGTGALIALGVLMLTAGAGAFMLVPLSAALLGFLAWNTNPASIFMGDAGSQFVGFILAAGALHWPDRDINLVAVLFVCAPLLVDTGFTLVRRALQGENIFQAHRTHLYQRLVALGYSHRAVANLYYGAIAVTMMAAAGYIHGSDMVRIVLLIVALMFAALYVLGVGLLEQGAVQMQLLLPSSGLDRRSVSVVRRRTTKDGASEKASGT